MSDPVWPGAPASLVAQWQARRRALGFGPGEALAPADADLAALAAARVPDAWPPLPEGASGHARKEAELAPQFAGAPALHLLHALTIAHLRKRRFPAHAPALFRRMWQEQAGVLLDLPPRWLISAAITFGDHGATEGERGLGRELGMMFSLMKLYEYERLFSGHPPTRAFSRRTLRRAPLPMGMEGFSLATGGLDVNLLAPLWLRAADEPVIGPLALALLGRLNTEPASLFRRLAAMRTEAAAVRRRRRPAPGTVPEGPAVPQT